MKNILFAITTWLFSSVAVSSVIEVDTFKLGIGVLDSQFKQFDKEVENYVSTLPGFISRSSGHAQNEHWIVIVHWETKNHAEAAMHGFVAAPETQAFLAHVDEDSMVMKIYDQVSHKYK